MKHYFPNQPEWTNEQFKVLNSKPNVVVSGCAGSGKTLLSCHIALKHSKDKTVAILVFTKALRTFITDYIKIFDGSNIKIMYEYEWRERSYPCYDIIIVDEFQDFSNEDIMNVLNCSRIGTYIFGDEEQKIYPKNLKKEDTITTETLLKQTKFRHIIINDNFRIPIENLNFISSVEESKSLKKSLFSTKKKPIIQSFNKVEDELVWLKDFLSSNNEFHNIGILFKQNDGFEDVYFHNYDKRREKVYGIIGLYEFLKKKQN